MEQNQEILDGLKTAMEAELTGFNFYKMAAENVTDPRAKETFAKMAEEEMGHFKYLRHQYQSVYWKTEIMISPKPLSKKPEIKVKVPSSVPPSKSASKTAIMRSVS